MENKTSNQIPITMPNNQIPITMPNSRPRNLKGKPSTSASFTFQENTQTPIHDEREVIETDPKVTQSIFEYLSSFPPGYRFNPTDVVLIREYLQPKIANKPLPPCLIHPVNLYNFHPKDLAERYLKHPGDDEVYYFTPRDRKYKNGSRPNRGVDGVGYWKASGSEVKIMLGDEIIGFVRTLTFYEGSSKTWKKTNWIMHEYRTCESRKRTSNEDMKLDDWVLCKICEKEEAVSSKNKNNNEEEANLTTDLGDTNTENAIIDDNVVKDEDTCPNSNNCCTSYHNDVHQSHQDMGLPFPQDSLYPLNTCRENFNMINENYASGSFSDELSCVPGTSYSNNFQTNYPNFYDQWEDELMCDNGFDCLLDCLDSCNLQDSSSGLNIKDSCDFQDSSSGLNIKDSCDFQDSSSRLNINEVNGEKQKDKDSCDFQDSSSRLNINEVNGEKQKELQNR